MLSYKEKSEKVMEGSASLSHLVFDDLPFSYTRLKNSFISSFSIWAGLLDLGEDSFVRILLCIL